MEDNVKIRKIGNSKGIIIPVEFVRKLNLQQNDIVNIRLVKGNKTQYLAIDPMKE